MLSSPIANGKVWGWRDSPSPTLLRMLHMALFPQSLRPKFIGLGGAPGFPFCTTKVERGRLPLRMFLYAGALQLLASGKLHPVVSINRGVSNVQRSRRKVGVLLCPPSSLTTLRSCCTLPDDFARCLIHALHLTYRLTRQDANIIRVTRCLDQPRWREALGTCVATSCLHRTLANQLQWTLLTERPLGRAPPLCNAWGPSRKRPDFAARLKCQHTRQE